MRDWILCLWVFDGFWFRILLGQALVEQAKWGAMVTVVGSAEHPVRQPVVGEGLSHYHVAGWYLLRARYRAEVGKMDHAVFDIRQVENIAARHLEEEERVCVMADVEKMRRRVMQLQEAAMRRSRTVMRGKKTGGR